MTLLLHTQSNSYSLTIGLGCPYDSVSASSVDTTTYLLGLRPITLFHINPLFYLYPILAHPYLVVNTRHYITEEFVWSHQRTSWSHRMAVCFHC